MSNIYFTHLLPSEHVLSMYVRGLRNNVLRKVGCEQRAQTGMNVPLGPQSLVNHSILTLLKDIKRVNERNRVLRQHSLIGFYSHSLNQSQLRDFLRTNRVNIRKQFKAVHSSKCQSSQAWRWCNECVAEDKKNVGVAYYHVEHQLPTSITCHRHSEKLLIQSCNLCGHSIRDLKKQPAPSASCSSCDGAIEQKARVLNEELMWVQERGLELHSSSHDILNPKFKYDMNHVVGAIVSLKTRRKGLSTTQKHNHYQPVFARWAKQVGAECFFTDDFSFEYDLAVNLYSTITTPAQASVLSHLLWMRFFGVKEFGEFERW